MELRVSVEGVVRVVCGLSQDTSCQDVVIALAQSTGQTGRYNLILKLQGTERQLLAQDCPLQLLSQLGQHAAEVQFILKRTGPSLSDRGLPLHRPSEPDPPRSREPHKAYNLGPRRTKLSRTWTPSPRASPEPRSSPVSFAEPLNPVSLSSSSCKEEEFRLILQQQRRLQDLETQIQALERETEVWELKRSSAPGPGLDLVSERELEELKLRLSLNQAELVHSEDWDGLFQEEMDRERDLHRRLHQIQLSMEDHSFQITELHARSAQLEQDLRLRAQSSETGPQQQDQALRPLKKELHHRLQQGEELDAKLSVTLRELQNAEEQLKDRWELMEELNKELRQCKLQQFIQQTGGPHADQTDPLPVSEVYLRNAGIME